MRGILGGAALVGLLTGIMLLRPDILPVDPSWSRGVGSGALLGVVGSLAGFWLLLRNLHAAHGRFLAAFFGAMLGRLALFAIILVLVVRSGGVPVAAFLAGLIPGYLGFQAAEMWYLHRTTGVATPAGDAERPR